MRFVAVLGASLCCLAGAAAEPPGAAPAPADPPARSLNPQPSTLNPGVDPRDATVLIRVASSLRQGRGSGFVIGDGGWVVTAYHVVGANFGKGRTVPEGTLLVLSPWTGRWYEAQLRAYDAAADIALLRLEVTGLPALPVEGLESPAAGTPLPWQGAELQLAGFPAHLGVEAQAEQAAADLRPAALFQLGEREGAATCFLKPCPGLQGGWSGGPITRADTGAAVALFHSVYRPREAPETPYPAGTLLSHLAPLLKAAGASPADFAAPALPTLPRAADARERVARQIRSITHATRGRWQQVEEEQRENLRLEPESAEARFLLGVARAAVEDWEGAIREFQAADAGRPRSVLVPLYLGLARQKKGEYALAEQELRRALDRFPADPEARIALGRVLIDQQKFDAAEGVLREAQRDRPHHPVVLYQLGLLELTRERPAAAAKELRAAIALTEHSSAFLSARVAYGRALEAMKRYREAEREYRTVTRRDPRSVEAHFYLANLYSKLGKTAEARLELARLRQLPVEDPAFVLGLKELEGKLAGK